MKLRRLLFILLPLTLMAQQPVTRAVVCTDAGATDTYACTPVPALGSYVAGQRVMLYANTVNTGAATLNISSLGATTIKKVSSGILDDLADGDIPAGRYAELIYDGTYFQLLSSNGGTSGGGGASTVAGLTDFKVTYINAANLSVNGGTIVIGTQRFTIASDTTCTLTATATDTAWFYLINGTFTIGMNDAGSSVACGTWDTATGITAFPANSTPIYKWTATGSAGSWDTTGGTDYRALFYRQELEADTGITVTENGSTGRQAIAIDSTTVSLFTTSTSDASGNCTTGQVWINTSSDTVWDCTHTNTWTERGAGATATAATSGIPAAKCQSGAAAATANLPATYAPTPACVTGTNTLFAVLQFPDSDGDYNIQDSFVVTTTSLNFAIKWRSTTATSGDVVWQLATACVADAETGDPSFNAAQTITDTAKGTTSQFNDTAITSVTTTGCAVGETLFWKLLRNRTHASDNIAGVVELISYKWY